jgi:hypothetical protein
MAKVNAGSVTFTKKPKRQRPGIVAKAKTSKTKTSKNYKKPNVGQG